MQHVLKGLGLATLCLVAMGCGDDSKSTTGASTGGSAIAPGAANAPAVETSSAPRQAAVSSLPVQIEVFAPGAGDHAGIGGAGWFIDMEVDFHGADLATTGFNGFQLTGPGVHANAAPFPKPGSPGRDESLPGLVVLCSTSTVGAGAGQNLAGLFNLTGVTNIDADETELWDTWILAGPACGKGVASTVLVAVVADLNEDGIYNDAPNVVPDANNDGKITPDDVRAIGLASNLVRIPFFINN